MYSICGKVYWVIYLCIHYIAWQMYIENVFYIDFTFIIQFMYRVGVYCIYDHIHVLKKH